MNIKVVNFSNQVVGEIELYEEVFNLQPRVDIVKLVSDWQGAKKMAGTHSTKTVSEVSGTTKKPFKQKGTGNARQGSLRSVHMRGGGVIHGPVVRSHANKLPKKVRKLGVKHALSSKLVEGKLIVIDSLALENFKTSLLSSNLSNFSGKSFLIIDNEQVNTNLAHAVRNIHTVAALPQIGANVRDIIKYDCVLISQEAIYVLQERLK